MKHSDAIQYWNKLAKSNPDILTAKVNPINDFTTIDAEFIKTHTSGTSAVLDLASGTGLTINKYYNAVDHVDAVEKFSELSKFTIQASNVNVTNKDILDYEPVREYDVILMFGIVQYFNELEIRGLYKKYKSALKPGGKLLVKNQFGVNSDVEVSGESEELHKEYVSQYRHIEKEEHILKSVGYKILDRVDIYPPEANRWENTHFYAIIAG